METYRGVLEKNPSDAARLIDAAIKLDHEDDLPLREIEDFRKHLQVHNPFALSLLRQMVVTHLYMFDLGYQENQKVCKALGIPYRDSKFVDPRFRKLGNLSNTQHTRSLPESPFQE